VLVVQSEAFNESRIGTIVIVTITSNLALADAPGNVRLPRDDTRLRKESVANVSQIMTLDRSFFVKRAGRLPEALRARVDAGLRLVLAL
jgi:mRNA interferase MazF